MIGISEAKGKPTTPVAAPAKPEVKPAMKVEPPPAAVVSGVPAKSTRLPRYPEPLPQNPVGFP